MEDNKIIDMKKYKAALALPRPARKDAELIRLLPNESLRNLYEICCKLYGGSPKRMIGDFEARMAGKPYLYKVKGNLQGLCEEAQRLAEIMETHEQRKEKHPPIKIHDYQQHSGLEPRL